jgi:hypothetical protein
MVRIGVEYIARNFTEYVRSLNLSLRADAHPSNARKRLFMDRYETALAPFTKARGIDWEVQITDCDVRPHSALLGNIL